MAGAHRFYTESSLEPTLTFCRSLSAIYKSRFAPRAARPRYASPSLTCAAVPPALASSTASSARRCLSIAKRSRAAVTQRAITRCPLALGWSLQRVWVHTPASAAGRAFLGLKCYE